MLKNDNEITLDVPARLIKDRTLVPVRAVSEGFGANVEWNEELKQVIITTQQPRTPEPSSDNKQPYNKLTDKDMQAVKESYVDIRYGFEQVVLPSVVLQENDGIIEAINQKSSDVIDYVYDTWSKVVATRIIQVQEVSESNYSIDDSVSEDQFIDDYMNLVKEAGLDSRDHFDVSFETLENGMNMMLLTFKETDSFLACKYIGIVVTPDNKIEYYTAETDPIETAYLFFCEVTLEGRGTINFIDFEKSDFVDAVGSLYNGGQDL